MIHLLCYGMVTDSADVRSGHGLRRFEDALAHGRSVDEVARHAHVRDGRATGGPSEARRRRGQGHLDAEALQPLTSRCMGSSLVYPFGPARKFKIFKRPPAYRSTDSIAVIEQDGPRVHVSFINGNGYVFGSSDVAWDPDRMAFVGSGELDTVCGRIDTRIWKAPVQQEIYVINDRVIRERWTQPTRVNCDRRRVDESAWQEVVRYAPD